MEKELQNTYRRNLSYDLIRFLLNIHIDGLSNEQKSARVIMILEAWEKKIGTSLEIIKNHNIQRMSTVTGESPDILEILHSIHSIETDLIREEFRNTIQQFIFKSHDIQVG